MKLKLLLTALALLLSSCAHSIHMYNVSDYTAEASKGKDISAEAEQFVIMSFTDNTDYVNQAYRKLTDSCPNGQVTGINSRYSTSMGFFSWHNKIVVNAKCLN